MNNIQTLRKLKGITQGQLAHAIGMSQGNLSKIENGEIELTADIAKQIAEYTQADIKDVMGAALSLSKYKDDFVSIEIIDAAASCGNGIENFSPITIGRQLISISNLRDITHSKPENIKILKARGDSMEPTINDSDIIWVDISYRNISGDGIYLFCIGSELFAKRARINFINQSIKITSDNHKYDPIEADNYQEISVLGKVISINKMLG